MLRFKIRERLCDKSFSENKRITFKELSKTTGVSRQTLTRMVNQRGYVTSTDTLEKLCAYFECGIGDLVEYVKETPGIESANLPCNKSHGV